MFWRRLKKSKYLRIVNLLGLSVIFSCLLLSFAYIKKELSYDRFHDHADRIVRLSTQSGSDPVDGRIYGVSKNSPLIADIPAVEDAVLMQYFRMGVLERDGQSEVINDLYAVSPNFFDVFSFRLLQGEKGSVLDAPEKAVISQKYARQLFGEESALGKEIKLSMFNDRASVPYYISGVFEDFPENSHFHTDLIVHRPENIQGLTYVYLLLHPGADMEQARAAIAGKMDEQYKDSPQRISPYMMPLTDIHLHSRVLRELGSNGNLHYVYLIAGANLLLLLIVLFNLWLNAGLIFSFNRKYYQLLRLNGASSATILKDESLLALALGLASILIGGFVSFFVFPRIDWFSTLTAAEIGLLSVSFLLLVAGVYLLPVIVRLPGTMFRNIQKELRPSNFALSKVKYLLIAQYGIVMFIVIVSFGITKQIAFIKTSQVGGAVQDSILAMKEQPEIIKQRYDLLKNELLKYPEIQKVTSAMQLPGSAIRDAIYVRTEGEGEDDGRYVQLLVVGNDFLPFFGIEPVAGTVFQEMNRTLGDEEGMFMDLLSGKPLPPQSEEYVINRKAVRLLGFESPEEAIGKPLYLRHEVLGYIDNGTIVGVTDDYNYATTYEETSPQILLQRAMFQHCIMVHLSPDRKKEALQTFNTVWNQVNPDYPADYTFLQDIYNRLYRNELNAEKLTRVFSLLCLIIANLGLIIIMAFVIKRKTKEIGIRKVNGATSRDIIRMLNSRFVVWIGVAFVLAIPLSYYVMNRWLRNFAYKTSLDWWVFALSGLLVLLLSAVSISWQSWQAATLNPVESLKSE